MFWAHQVAQLGQDGGPGGSGDLQLEAELRTVPSRKRRRSPRRR